MKLKDIYIAYKADVFDEIPADEVLMKETDDWGYYSSISLSGIIAIGWFSNDDLLIINGDGVFIYDIRNKSIAFRDFDTPLRKNISENNLSFFVQSRYENISIFGLRGGGGNLLTKDNIWSLYATEIDWNIKIPRISNNRSGKVCYLELSQNNYEGYMYLGFSLSEDYFVIMGDQGVDFFFKKI